MVTNETPVFVVLLPTHQPQPSQAVDDAGEGGRSDPQALGEEARGRAPVLPQHVEDADLGEGQTQAHPSLQAARVGERQGAPVKLERFFNDLILVHADN